MLRLYNYLTRKKEEFRPLKKATARGARPNRGRVGLYTCGPTVYNYAHIGNLRTYIFEDILRRSLEFSGLTVKHVMNITDVDDKTIRDSKHAGKTLKAFTEFYSREFFKDIKRLGIVPAWKYPRATTHVKEMVALIQILLRKKIAYQTEDGVYFSIKKFKPYGALSGVKSRTLKVGARVSADEYSKAEVNDFSLWKFKKPGEPSWKAPFGEGRPGWHIECSAMSMKYLGTTFDIHAGGIDLLFPHHEDEIAQSEAATGKQFVRVFIEGEHLMVDGKKMSKSLGNMYRLSDIEKKDFDPLDFRYFVLGAHYRTPLNFTWKAIQASRNARLKLLNSIAELRTCIGKSSLKEENEVLKVISHLEKQFLSAIEDDLNMPKALATLIELIHYANAIRQMGHCSPRTSKMLFATIKEFDRVLGLKLDQAHVDVIPENVQKLAAEREQSRNTKQWQEADRIRNEIRKLGYEIEDTSSGPRIKKL